MNFDDVRILVALVSGIIAFIISILSLIYTNKNLKRTHNHQKEIELLKAELQSKLAEDNIGRDFKKDKLKKAITSIEIGIREIQRLKDALQLFLNGKIENIDIEDLVKNYSKVHESMVNAYQHSTAPLSNSEEDKVFHSSKNLSNTIMSYLKNIFDEYNDDSDGLTIKLRSKVESYKTLLSEYQNQLRDCQVSYLKDKI